MMLDGSCRWVVRRWPACGGLADPGRPHRPAVLDDARPNRLYERSDFAIAVETNWLQLAQCDCGYLCMLLTERFAGDGVQAGAVPLASLAGCLRCFCG